MSRQAHLRRVFDLALAMPPDQRAAVLDRECRGDAALRAEVEALLRAELEAGGFMSSPTADAAQPLGGPTSASDAATLAAPLREGPGTRIGPYKILQLIGEGGFGSVFMAEQEKPVARKVALKIIKLGMDTRQVIARFEAERQALALMDHPNIAKVLDAGATEAGRPYFVMELCKGEPIVEYCDRNNLSIEDRLELFAQVCNAVQHAHTKGIIHRDIKPSNILVSTQDGRPSAKVIDFGIAKATASKLTEKTLFTEHKALIGTPEYMSPEQAEGSLDIDTRTDVYSLGVLLYELLTGTTPFSSKELRSAAYAEIQRIIREVEPPKPSTRISQNTDTLASVAAKRHSEPRKLGTIVRGELDWIVMKALEKDRQRRYETANGLAMDIRRYLAGDAVVAAPPSAAYRVRKFVKRNRVQVAAAALIALALVLGMAGTAWQAKVASDQAAAARAAENEATLARDAEKTRADELKQVSDFQAGMLAQIDPTTAGVRLTEDVNRRFAAALEKMGVSEAERTPRADAFRQEWLRVNATDAALALIDETILRPAVKAIDEQFKDQPLVDAQLRHALAERYFTLGLYDPAYPLQESALATRRRVLGEEHPDTLTSISNMGFLLQAQGKPDQAEPYYREALEKRRRVLGEEHPGTLTSINNMGFLLEVQGKLGEAEPYLREALASSRRVLGDEHPDTLISILNMGGLLQGQGKYAEAEPYYREALEKRLRVLGEEHPDTLTSISNMGVLLLSQGKLTEAELHFREALERRRRVLGEEHPDTLISINNMGAQLHSQGRYADAEPYQREALEKSRRVLGEEHPNTLHSLNNLGLLLRAQGKLAEAEMILADGVRVCERTFSSGSPESALVLHHHAEILSMLGRNQEALGGARRAHALYTQHPDWSPDEPAHAAQVLVSVLNALNQSDEAMAVQRDLLALMRSRYRPGSAEISGQIAAVGFALLKRGTLDAAREAEPLLRECLAIRENVQPDAWTTFNAKSLLGGALLGQNTLAEAEPLLLAGYQGMKEREPTIDPASRSLRVPEALERLVKLYEAWDKAEPGKGYDAKAAEWKVKLEAAHSEQNRPAGEEDTR